MGDTFTGCGFCQEVEYAGEEFLGGILQLPDLQISEADDVACTIGSVCGRIVFAGLVVVDNLHEFVYGQFAFCPFYHLEAGCFGLERERVLDRLAFDTVGPVLLRQIRGPPGGTDRADDPVAGRVKTVRLQQFGVCAIRGVSCHRVGGDRRDPVLRDPAGLPRLRAGTLHSDVECGLAGAEECVFQAHRSSPR